MKLRNSIFSQGVGLAQSLTQPTDSQNAPENLWKKMVVPRIADDFAGLAPKSQTHR